MTPRSAAHPLEPSPRAPRAGRLWAALVVWLAVVAALFYVDASWSAAIREAAPDPSIQRRAFKLAQRAIMWPTYVLIAAAIVLVAPGRRIWPLDPQRQRRLLGFAATIGITAAAVQALKYVIGRCRPIDKVGELDVEIPHGPYDFQPLSGDPYVAFPSGHAAMATMLALLVWFYFPRLRWIAAPIALMACVTRIIQGQHFVSDVIAGVGLAIVCGLIARRIVGRDAFTPIRFTTPGAAATGGASDAST